MPSESAPASVPAKAGNGGYKTLTGILAAIVVALVIGAVATGSGGAKEVQKDLATHEKSVGHVGMMQKVTAMEGDIEEIKDSLKQQGRDLQTLLMRSAGP